MIIVSQNKTEIVNFNNIGKIYISENYEVNCLDIQGCFLTSLGIFDTEERAKEVLQDIVARYEAIESIDYTPIFEMPKE